MPSPRKPLAIRCFCAREPLLAQAGRDTRTGDPFLHVKTWKGDRLYVELVVTSGVVRLRCRECLRWHTVRIVKGDMKVKPEPIPDTIELGGRAS
jgi:hypothetical protein